MNEAAYTLHYVTAHDPSPAHPYEGEREEIAAALLTARENQRRGGYSVKITREDETFLERAEIEQAISIIEQLEGERPGQDWRLYVERALHVMGKA